MSLQRPGFAAQSSVISDLADFRQDPFKGGKKIVSVPEAHQDGGILAGRSV